MGENGMSDNMFSITPQAMVGSVDSLIGAATAYADAVAAGYTGTREQWAEDMAKLGENLAAVRTEREKAEDAAQTAVDARDTAVQTINTTRDAAVQTVNKAAETAEDAAVESIEQAAAEKVGEINGIGSVRFDGAQELTIDEQTQARANIGAASADKVGELSNEIDDLETELATGFDKKEISNEIKKEQVSENVFATIIENEAANDSGIVSAAGYHRSEGIDVSKYDRLIVKLTAFTVGEVDPPRTLWTAQFDPGGHIITGTRITTKFYPLDVNGNYVPSSTNYFTNMAAINTSYTHGGASEITINENAKTIVFYNLRNGDTATVSLVGEYHEIQLGLEFKNKIPVTHNLFVMDDSTTQEDVYLGKDADGNEMYGWYLSSIGSVGTNVSGTGLDSISGKIAVIAGEQYSKNKEVILSVFDSDDKLVETYGLTTSNFIMNKNAVAARLTFASSKINNAQLCLGTELRMPSIGRFNIDEVKVPETARMMDLLHRNALYYDFEEDYMRGIAQESLTHATPNNHTFLWISDTHTQNGQQYISSKASAMTKYVPCSYIAHCGDVIDGVSERDNELKVLTDLSRNFNDACCPTFYVRGNHDHNYQHYLGTPDVNKVIDSDEMAIRTVAFAKDRIIGNLNRMYYYVDNENNHIRSIFLNSFDYDKEEFGVEDTTIPYCSEEQIEWLKSALLFDDKDDDDWGVIVFSHQFVKIDIIGHYVAGRYDYAEQGERELIAWFVGDDHYDALKQYPTWEGGWWNKYITKIHILNASLARDNIGVPSDTNGVLMPPVKTMGTENETAFDIVTIDRENKLIYLTRYGARSYAYNADTSAFDKITARTRVIDYSTASYTVLTE